MRTMLSWLWRRVFPERTRVVCVHMRCSMCGVKDKDVGLLVSNGQVFPPHCPECAIATVKVRALSRHQGER